MGTPGLGLNNWLCLSSIIYKFIRGSGGFWDTPSKKTSRKPAVFGGPYFRAQSNSRFFTAPSGKACKVNESMDICCAGLPLIMVYHQGSFPARWIPITLIVVNKLCPLWCLKGGFFTYDTGKWIHWVRPTPVSGRKDVSVDLQ